MRVCSCVSNGVLPSCVGEDKEVLQIQAVSTAILYKLLESVQIGGCLSPLFAIFAAKQED